MSATSHRVLVADDHPLIVRLLRDTLTEAGHEVVVESAADRVADVAAREHPDLALVDVNMKPCERFHALRALRELPDGQPRAIIVLSGDDSPGIRERAFELGADEVVVKPWDPDELLELAERLLG